MDNEFKGKVYITNGYAAFNHVIIQDDIKQNIIDSTGLSMVGTKTSGFTRNYKEVHMKKLLLAVAAVAMMGSVAAAKPVEVHNAAAATIVVKIHDDDNRVIRSWEVPTGQTFKYEVPEKDHEGNPIKNWRVSASNAYGCLLYTSPSPRDS